MKDTDNDILKKADHKDGMIVPEGYFDDFASKMEDSLPEMPWERADFEENQKPRTTWQKIRPYVYMAAMFMGIWCMLHMFNMIKSPADVMTAGDNPVLAEALDNESFMMDYYVYDVDEYEILDHLYDQGVVITSYNQ